MRKKIYLALEEYLTKRHLLPLEQNSPVVREKVTSTQRRMPENKAKWVNGNLFECHAGDDSCNCRRVPFGGVYYCSWPLTNRTADLHHKPPCLWDSE